MMFKNNKKEKIDGHFMDCVTIKSENAWSLMLLSLHGKTIILYNKKWQLEIKWWNQQEAKIVKK